MERTQAEVIDRLLAAGWIVTVIARSCEIDHPRLTFNRVPAPKRPFVVAYPWFVLLASVMLRRYRSGATCVIGANVLVSVDVCVVQFCHAAFQHLGAVPRTRRGGLTGRLSDALGRRLAIGMERWAYRPGRVGHYIAVSQRIADELGRWYGAAPDSVTVIPNGVDANEFRPDAARRRRVRESLGIADDELVALFVGGDWPRKGLAMAIEAVSRAEAWSLAVAGDGDSGAYSALADQVGARVVFAGPTARPQDVFAAADAFVLPTAYEGFALVALEAAASGLPLLTTAASGAHALVDRSGDSVGFLARDAEAFADALCRLSSAGARTAQGTALRRAVGAFAWPGIAEAYERVLSAAAAKGGP